METSEYNIYPDKARHAWQLQTEILLKKMKVDAADVSPFYFDTAYDDGLSPVQVADELLRDQEEENA